MTGFILYAKFLDSGNPEGSSGSLTVFSELLTINADDLSWIGAFIIISLRLCRDEHPCLRK